ncbi:MAG: phosphate-starvation-inducible PsiE family protein [Acidimicrobiales bacterium]
MSPATDTRHDRLATPANRILHFAENAVYGLAGIFLVAAAVSVLASVGYHLALDVDDGVEPAITTALDGLLLVFILLELLAAVRATMVERRLIAEPFLVAGIIASIKEIIVVALRAKDSEGVSQGNFDDAMTEIGVLGGIVLLLALATYLVRRKEREPEEQTSGAGQAAA